MADFKEKVKSACEYTKHFFVLHPKVKKLVEITLILVVMLLAILIIALSGHPSYDNTRVVSASLKQFNFTNNTLNYYLIVEILLRNPNNAYRAHYDHINITAIYKNQAFATMFYPPFSQGASRETLLTPSFKGQYSPTSMGSGGDISKWNDSGAGYYDIVIKVDLENESVRTLVPHRKVRRKLEYTCELKGLMVNGNGNGFNTTGCTYI